MNPLFIIAPFEPDDTEALATLWYESWLSAGVDTKIAVTQAALLARIPKEIETGWEVWTAKNGDDLLGFAALKPKPGQLDQLFVSPEAQGRGIGTALLDYVKTLSPKGLLLWCATQNASACRFYERHGFASGAETLHRKLGHPIRLYTWLP
jgi:GNAT superfamily N-acetyltransferase